MPIYAFDCQTCGEPFEELVFNTSKLDEISCPDCGSTRVKKKLSTFATRIASGQNGTQAAAGANCAPGGL